MTTNVAPLALAEIADPELRALVERSAAAGVPGDVLPRIAARAPALAKDMLRVSLMTLLEGNVDHRLKEIMRIMLARFAGDDHFAGLRSTQAIADGLDEARIEAGCGDYEDSALFSAAEKAALRFADQLYLDPGKVDRAFYDELKQHWSEAEIMEMGAMLAFHYGLQVWMRTLAAGADDT